METTSRGSDPQPASLVRLFSDLWRETSALFRAETELVRAEVSEKIAQIQTAVIALAVGAVILFAAFLLLLAAAVNGLAQVLPPDQAAWLSPLIVGVLAAIIGLIALAKGRRDLETSNLKPSRSMHSLRRDSQLAREHLR
jgi:hypothetical protein